MIPTLADLSHLAIWTSALLAVVAVLAGVSKVVAYALDACRRRPADNVVSIAERRKQLNAVVARP